MNVILINHFLDVDSDTIQHSGGSEGNLIKDKTIVMPVQNEEVGMMALNGRF